jgi:hypothetical protein
LYFFAALKLLPLTIGKKITAEKEAAHPIPAHRFSVRVPTEGSDRLSHDYYSILFNLNATFFISEKNRSHKTKNPLLHLVPCYEMLIIVLNCLYI